MRGRTIILPCTGAAYNGGGGKGGQLARKHRPPINLIRLPHRAALAAHRSRLEYDRVADSPVVGCKKYVRDWADLQYHE